MARRNFVQRTVRILLATSLLAAPAAAQQTMRPLNPNQPAAQDGGWLKMPWSGKGRSRSHASSPLTARDVSPQQKTAGQFAMARLAERRDQTDAAKQIYEALIKKHPREAGSYHRLGVIAAKEGDAQRAAELLLTARRLSPEDPEILRDLGYLYYVHGELDEAESAYRAGLQLKQDHVGLTNNYAMLLAERQRYQEAFDLFIRVSEPAQAHANMGFMLVQMGYLDKAESFFSQALNLDSGLKTAAHGLLQVAQLKQEAAAARQRESAGEQVAHSGGEGKADAERGAVGRASLASNPATKPVTQVGLSDAATKPQASRIRSSVQPSREIRPVASVEKAPLAPAPAQRLDAQRLDAQRLDPPRSGGRRAVGTAPRATNSDASSGSSADAGPAPGPARQRNTLRIRTSRSSATTPGATTKADTTNTVQTDRGNDSPTAAARSLGDVEPAGPNVESLIPGGQNWSTSRFPTSQPTWTPESKKLPPAQTAN